MDELENEMKFSLINESDYKSIEDFKNDVEFDVDIAFISDLHLPPKYPFIDAKTEGKKDEFLECVSSELNADQSLVKIIAGDITSDFNEYKKFISK